MNVANRADLAFCLAAMAVAGTIIWSIANAPSPAPVVWPTCTTLNPPPVLPDPRLATLTDNDAVCMAGVPQLVVDQLPKLTPVPTSRAKISEAAAQQMATNQLQGLLIGQHSYQLVGYMLAEIPRFERTGTSPFWVFIFRSHPSQVVFGGLAPNYCTDYGYVAQLVNASGETMGQFSSQLGGLVLCDNYQGPYVARTPGVPVVLP